MAKLYFELVKLTRQITLGILLAALAGLAAGCSGINVTKSVSPASFFLPGLMKADPPAPAFEQDLPKGMPVREKIEQA